MTGSSRPPAGPQRARRRPVSLPLARRLSLIAGLLLLIVGCLVLLAGLGMETLSAVRAYVGAESLWSKAQKEAVHHLTRYALSHAEGDYQAYLSGLAVPLGDRQARLELEKPQPDLQVVSEGLRAGGNHPEDVEGMANLFRRFRRVPQMARAIDIWAEGDAEIARLRHLGEALHDAIQSMRRADRAATIAGLDRADSLQRDRNAAVFLATVGPDNPQYVEAKLQLALVALETGRLSEAETLTQTVLEAVEKTSGRESPFMAECFEMRAASLRKIGREPEAVALEDSAQVLRLRWRNRLQECSEGG